MEKVKEMVKKKIPKFQKSCNRIWSLIIIKNRQVRPQFCSNSPVRVQVPPHNLHRRKDHSESSRILKVILQFT